MLSRAIRSEDSLLIRQPDVEFLARGPPEDLREPLKRLAARTEEGRTEAKDDAERLGFDRFLH